MKNSFSLLVILIIALYSVYPEDITPVNWKNHPRIKAVREKVREIDAMIKNGECTVESKKKDVPGGQQERIIFEKDGNVIFYKIEGGGESIAYNDDYYYENGKLIFIYSRVGRVFGPNTHRRFYFDNGVRFWFVNDVKIYGENGLEESNTYFTEDSDYMDEKTEMITDPEKDWKDFYK